jgi:6-pyruvoyl-tetrahydropterin synthase
MPVRISKAATAEIAHFLPGHKDFRNTKIHGHSIIVTATVEGELRDGMVEDFGLLGELVSFYVGLLDHRFLNEDCQDIGVPTLENIATWVALRLQDSTARSRLISVKVERPTCHESAEWVA